MYQTILRDAQKQIYYWKTFWYESQSKENLLQGYKKVIQELSNRLIKRQMRVKYTTIFRIFTEDLKRQERSYFCRDKG